LAEQFEPFSFLSDLPVLLVVLKGGVYFAHKFLEKVGIDFNLQFVSMSSYKEGTNPEPIMNVVFHDSSNWADNKDVFIIDDVADTFNTLAYLKKCEKLSKTRTIQTCVLVEKPARRTIQDQPDHYALRIDSDIFIVGCGMGVGEKYRWLPAICEYLGEEENVSRRGKDGSRAEDPMYAH